MISMGGKRMDKKFSYLILGNMSYSDAFRGISPEPYFCAEFKVTGTDELIEQPKYKCDSPNVYRG